MRRARGFTLVELVITMAVFAVLAMLITPGFGRWMANARMRTVAESVQNGLRLAQAEAMRRNRQTAFALTDVTPGLAAAPKANGSNWYVRALPLASEDVDSTFYVQGGTFASEGVTITGPALVCFNSLGRQTTGSSKVVAVDCAAPADAVYAVTRTGSADRRLQVQVSLAGKVRMCDPDRDIAKHADGC